MRLLLLLPLLLGACSDKKSSSEKSNFFPINSREISIKVTEEEEQSFELINKGSINEYKYTGNRFEFELVTKNIFGENIDEIKSNINYKIFTIRFQPAPIEYDATYVNTYFRFNSNKNDSLNYSGLEFELLDYKNNILSGKILGVIKSLWTHIRSDDPNCTSGDLRGYCGQRTAVEIP